MVIHLCTVVTTRQLTDWIACVDVQTYLHNSSSARLLRLLGVRPYFLRDLNHVVWGNLCQRFIGIWRISVPWTWARFAAAPRNPRRRGESLAQMFPAVQPEARCQKEDSRENEAPKNVRRQQSVSVHCLRVQPLIRMKQRSNSRQHASWYDGEKVKVKGAVTSFLDNGDQ